MKEVLGIVAISWMAFVGWTMDGRQDQFVNPESPFVLEEAPSQQVKNGHTFESGTVQVAQEQTLVFPESAVVEEYDGDELRFFLTKSLHVMGHPPSPIRVNEVSDYYGVAWKESDGELLFSTYGEWANRGGSASIKVLVLVPQDQPYHHAVGLEGEQSQAATEMDFDEEALTTKYWYTGIQPKESWVRVETRLNFNRFLQP